MNARLSAACSAQAARRAWLHGIVRGSGIAAATLASPLAGCAATRARGRVRVGPDGDVATIAQAARLATNGDTVEVQAGEYHGDVAVWAQKQLTIRAVGGRARLVADGRSAEGKAIWVIRNGAFEIDGFDFVGARVPDRNGAGIRFERGSLLVRDCRFVDNEMGLLSGNVASAELVVDRCEFRGPVRATDIQHNLYVGRIGRLTVRASWSHRGHTGHLLKSRARENHILYNRLADADGTASYELEFPDGGIARVVGNVIEQSTRTSNAVIVSFGAEGYHWPANELAMSHNTLVNLRPAGGTFVRAAPGPARVALLANVWAGRGRLQLPVPTLARANVELPLTALRGAEHGDDRLTPEAAASLRTAAGIRVHFAEIGEGLSIAPGELVPTEQYVHERRTSALTSGGPLLPGALQG